MDAEKTEYVRSHFWSIVVFLAAVAEAVILIQLHFVVGAVCSNVTHRANAEVANTAFNQEFMRSAADVRAAAALRETGEAARADRAAARRYRKLADSLVTVAAPEC